MSLARCGNLRTLVTSLIGLLIAVPISLAPRDIPGGTGPNWLKGPASFIIEMAGGDPSVIIGYGDFMYWYRS